MSSSLGRGERQNAQRLRRAPGQITNLVATFADGSKIPSPVDDITGPIHIVLETTDANGTLATWVHDDWFTTLLQRFGDEFVTLRIAPTPSAILHPSVLYESEMARRVVPHWRVVAAAYIDDIQTDDEINAIANGPYHEVQFFDHARIECGVTDRFSTHLSVEKLFVRLRQAQEKSTGRSPILVRLPEGVGPVSGPHKAAPVDPNRTRPSDATISS